MHGPASDDDWQELARSLLEIFGDRVSDAGRPTWVRLMESGDRPDGPDLYVSDDDAGLVGWTAPDDCLAVGIVATAKVTLEDSPREAPPGLPVGTTPGFRLVCVVARSGYVAWQMVTPDGQPWEDPPQEGRLLDALRRCFGLPTSPPPVGTGRLHAITWLSRVLDEVTIAERSLSWRDLLLLNPFLAAACDDDHRLPDPDTFADLLELADDAITWEQMRARAAEGSDLNAIVDQRLAGWMDEGMFARWVLSELPAPEQMVELIRPHVAPSTARRLAHTVRLAA